MSIEKSHLVFLLAFFLTAPFSSFAEPEEEFAASCPKGQQLTRVSLIAGPTATLISTGLTYPLDLSKIRRQFMSSEKGNLYKGFWPFSAAVVTSVGTTLAGYDLAREHGYSPAKSGAMSAFFANAIGTPLWVYRTKKSLSPAGEPDYSLNAYFQDLKKNPAMAQRGQVMNLLNLPAHALYFQLYETFKISLKEPKTEGSELPDWASTGIAGATAKLSVALIGHPADTIRVIRQETGAPYSEIFSDLKRQGALRLFRGFGFATAKVCLGTALQMSIYEAIKGQTGAP